MPEHSVFMTDIHMRFRDIDAMGHVNNAVYFTYFESGRWQFFYSEAQQEKFQEISFILAHVRCDYIKALTLDDHPVLYMWTGAIGSKSFTLFYRMVERTDRSVVYATGQSVQVCYDYEKNTSLPISDQIRQQLALYQKEPA